MDDAFTVKTDAVVYIDRGAIVAVQDRAMPAPAGFDDVASGGDRRDALPGLIELHNHLSYNALPLWSPVPKLFQHRGQWPDHPDYRKLISGPMTVVGEYRDAQGKPALLAPLVRYVECKCLLGGVTTSQGIMLSSNAGVQRFYRGIVRNVEQTDDPDLFEAQGRIADVDAKDARSFLARLKKEDSCFLLHLSEGVTKSGQADSVARRHFLALQVAPDEWAINDRFAGIHAAGLLARGLRRARPARGRDDLVAAQQPAALRGHRARGRGQAGRGAHRPGQRLVAFRQQEPAGRAEGGVALLPAHAGGAVQRA